MLILGTTDNAYYASGAELTLDAVRQLTPLTQARGARVVQRIADISAAGRASSNTPALMLLALVVGDNATKRLAVDAVPRVARTGTYIQELRKPMVVFDFRAPPTSLRTDSSVPWRAMLSR